MQSKILKLYMYKKVIGGLDAKSRLKNFELIKELN